MKKFFFAALLFVSLIGIIPVQAASFSDVAQNSDHFAALEYLKNKGIIQGYGDGTFKPENSINRAEALKMVFSAMKLYSPTTNLPTSSTLSFKDVQKKDWFYEYVNQAFNLKIIQGYDANSFKPQNPINLAESLKITLKAFNVALSQTVLTQNPYPDVDKSSWYAQFVQYSKEKHLIAAEKDANLHVDKNMTRGSFAEILYRFLYIKDANAASFPLNLNWPTFTHPKDHYLLKYPLDWEKIEAGSQMIFWKQDKDNGQVSFSRIFPNSATVIAVLDANSDKLSLDQYLAKIQYDTQAKITKGTSNSYPFANISIASSGTQDFYFELPNKTMLILYCQNGDGSLKNDLQDEIAAIADSVRYSEAVTPASPTPATPSPIPISPEDTFLSQLRTNLLLKNKGKNMLDLLQDKVIIETDTIGIGTGPIDYYYTAKYNVTIKYERNSDTLLATKEGKTSAF